MNTLLAEAGTHMTGWDTLGIIAFFAFCGFIFWVASRD